MRIVFVARFDTGGSVVSLHALLAHLDRSHFSPVVLFYRRNPWCQRFREIDVEVRILNDDDSAKQVPSADPLPRPVSRAAAPLKRFRPVRLMGKFVRRDVPLARRIADVFRSEDPDLVSHNDNLRAHRASVMAGWLSGVRQLCHIRSLTDYLPLVDVPLARTLDGFIYISSSVADQCRRELHLGAEKGSVIWDPVDLSLFSDAASRRDAVRAELGIDSDHPLVANVGRLVPGKGQDVFLRGFARLADRHPRARALIVGGVGPGDRGIRFRRKLQTLVGDLSLEDRVSFMGHREDVPEIMAAADVVVQSSSKPEGLGRVAMEAMAAGRPVVGTEAGGPVDVIEHDETGYLVPMGDSKAMADALDDLLSDPATATEMGRRGRRIAEERFGIEAHVDRVTTVYEQLFEGRNPTQLLGPSRSARRAGAGN